MTERHHSRRGVLALAAVGLAGCTASESSSEDDTAQTDDDDPTPATESDDEEPPERSIDPDWETAQEFRTWLLEDSANSRFDYTETFPDGVDLEGALPEFTDLTMADVDAHLVQSFTQVVFGSFDPGTIADDAATSEDAEVHDPYEGFAVIEEDLPTGETHMLAVGPEAIVIGDDYEARIDAHLGEKERLEEVDPEFTHLFNELPHETTVTGEYGPPAGGVDVPEIYLWGVSSERPAAEEATWVFVFADDSDLTEETLTELEEVSSDVTESSVDDRTASVVGAPPELPDLELPDEESDHEL